MWGLLLALSVILGGLSCILAALELGRFLLKRRMGEMSALAWAISIFLVFDAFGHWAVMLPKPGSILAYLVCGVAKIALLPVVHVLIRSASRFPMPGEFNLPEGRAKLLEIAKDYAPRGTDADRGPGDGRPAGP